MLLVNGVIHPVDGPVISRGFVRWEGERIVQVGPMEALDGGAEDALDAAGGHVTPGYIDAHCHLGLFGDALGPEGADANEETDPVTPQLRALDALNPLDACFADARRAGVTTVVTGPGSTNPIGGQMVCVRTWGRVAEEMVLQAPAAMKMALGENPKAAYRRRGEGPATRMATAARIREALGRARDYAQRLDRGERPDFDPKAEALRPVLRGEVPVHIHAHRADDIATALRLGREFGLRLVLLHGTEGHLIPDVIAAAGCPVIAGPNLTDRSKPELKNASLTTPAALHRAGVEVALCTDHPEVPVQYLPLCAALAVRGGLEEEAALAAITLVPARILGLADRLGSLTAGKAADIVVTPGHPLDPMAAPSAVILNGRRAV